MHSLHDFSLLLLASVLCIHLSLPHHIQEIGKMVGTLSYIHTIVPVNISGLVQAVHNFCHDILALQKLYQDLKQHFGTYDEWFHSRIINLLELSLADANSMLSTLKSLRDSLPPVTAESNLTLNAMHEYRVKRISPIAIISGIIGMLMGWIMQLCLNIPRDLLDELQDWQNWLLQI